MTDDHIEITVFMSRKLHDEIVAYCDQKDGASVAWMLRRSARYLLDEETDQSRRMETFKRQQGVQTRQMDSQGAPYIRVGLKRG